MKQPPKVKTCLPVVGDNTVDAVRDAKPVRGVSGRIWINQAQHFDKVLRKCRDYKACQKGCNTARDGSTPMTIKTHYRGIAAVLARTI